jgi:hypothetical protein
MRRNEAPDLLELLFAADDLALYRRRTRFLHARILIDLATKT